MAKNVQSRDQVTPVLVGLTGYYAVAGLASLNNVAAAVWIMVLIYGVPVLAAGAAMIWIGARMVLARRSTPRRTLLLSAQIGQRRAAALLSIRAAEVGLRETDHGAPNRRVVSCKRRLDTSGRN